MLKQKLFFFPNVSGKRVGCAFPPSTPWMAWVILVKNVNRNIFVYFQKFNFLKKKSVLWHKISSEHFFNELRWLLMLLNKSKQSFCRWTKCLRKKAYRVTHKGWDFRDDCTELILFCFLTFMIPWNLVSSHLKSFKLFNQSHPFWVTL